MALIIQKFGGTSLADPSSRGMLADKVHAEISCGNKVVLVVSAMGREGDPYATDTLLGLLGEYGRRQPSGLIEDLLASTGETISACVIAALLESKGIQAEPMTAYSAGIHGEGPFGDAAPARIDAERLFSTLRRGVVPVITGFQAYDAENRILTLGRGGSDTTAVAIGAAIKSDFIDIYKDVPGVAKADPRIVPHAPFMSFLDYDAMFRLAFHGARVLHDKSADLAKKNNLAMRIRPTFDSGLGTRIGPRQAGDSVPRFIGISTVKAEGGTMKVTAVFDAGRGAEGIVAAKNFAASRGELFQVQPIDCGDPDAIGFLCPPGVSREFTQALFDTLEN